MFIDDAEYFTQRALCEMRTASTSFDDNVARAHLQLSGLLLQHAGTLIAGTVADAAPAPLRLVEAIAA